MGEEPATAPLRMAETALPQPVRDGHRQLAPRSRPRPGRALRQPLLPGPRSSPFHIRWQFGSGLTHPAGPAGEPGAPPNPGPWCASYQPLPAPPR